MSRCAASWTRPWCPAPVLLERLIANLVSNAITYHEPGGWVEVIVTAEAALTVRNTGQEVPAEAVPALLEPFRRLGADRVRGRGGVGLGLAIVRSIVGAHQGTLHARPRPEGGLIRDSRAAATAVARKAETAWAVQ